MSSALLLPLPLENSADTSDSAVQATINVAQLLLYAAIGLAAGAVAALVLSVALRAVFRRSRVMTAVLGRARGPFYWMLISWGAWLAVRLALADTDLSAMANGVVASGLRLALNVLAIATTTWTAFAAAWVVEDSARLRHRADEGKSRRFETQAQILRRLIQVVIAILGVSWALFVVFPGAQRALSAVLASAGVLSVIAGLAAQSTLGNVFAGIQLAFADAIRVGDIVVVGPNNDNGAIEEITLTYVVVRVWDERRLIMPSSYFTTEPFENWTRRASKQLGTVELTLDWAAPMAQIRSHVEQLLLTTDLWDGRTWNVQMTDSDRDSVTVRVLVSAKDSGDLWDLRCYLRENLVSWLASEESWARPVSRYHLWGVVVVDHDEPRDLVARLATELSGIASSETTAGGSPAAAGTPTPIGAEQAGGPTASPADGAPPAGDEGDSRPGSGPSDFVHAARLQAARRRAKRARRKALAERQRQTAQGRAGGEPDDRRSPISAASDEGVEGPAFGSTSGALLDGDRTRVFTPEELRDIARRYVRSSAPGAGHSDEPASPESRVASARPGEQTREMPAVQAGEPPSSATTSTAASLPGAASTTQTTGGGRGERLYSGSPDAEERRAVFAGPGEDAIAEREAIARDRARRQAERDAGTGEEPANGETGRPAAQ